MPQSTPNPRIFISVAEQSADEHAAALIRAFTKRQPGAVFAGLTGPSMRAVGCETFHDMTTRSAMALAAIRRIPEALRLLHRLKTYLTAERFDAAVMVDSPTLNLPIAKICRRQGIRVLYYIAPQTWAWAAWRNTRIRHRVNRLACIWPFEEDYFRSHGIPAAYVGHPTFEHLLAIEIDEAHVAELRADHSPVVVLMPGSREHVVREVLPGQIEIAEALKKRFRHARFLIVPANDQIRRLIESIIDASSLGSAIVALSVAGPVAESLWHQSLWHRRLGGGDTGETLVPQKSGDMGETPVPQQIGNMPLSTATLRAAAIRAADLVLVASGTATLEVAYHGTPMIVMYNAGRWTYQFFGRWLIATKHLSIPNILAGRRVVPEFMPYYRSTDPIIATATEWLSTPATLARIRQELADVIKPIVKPGAAENAAAELDAMLTEAPLR